MPWIGMIGPQKEYDRVYASVYNNEASAAIPAGGACCFQSAAPPTGFVYGRTVIKPITADLNLFAGLAAETSPSTLGIPAKTWGRIIVWGVVEEAYVDGGTTNIAVGDRMIPTNASFYLNAPVATVGAGWVFAMEAQASTSVTGRVFVRAM